MHDQFQLGSHLYFSNLDVLICNSEIHNCRANTDEGQQAAARKRRQYFLFFSFMEKMPVFLDDGIYTRLHFHAHQATERENEFRREKKRNA